MPKRFKWLGLFNRKKSLIYTQSLLKMCIFTSQMTPKSYAYRYRQEPDENPFFSSEKSYTKKAFYDFLYVKDNHLGNVLAVVTDRKIPRDANNDGIIDSYVPDVVFAADYYDGVGMAMPGRLFEGTPYRFGAQGSEVDKEINGTRNTITTFNREGDLQTLRWYTPDPKKNASWSPYVMNNDNGVSNNDPNGDVVKPVTQRSADAFADLVSTFTTQRKGKTYYGFETFGITTNKQGEVFTEKGFTQKDFLKNARKAGITGERLKQAKAVFNVINSKDVYELAIVKTTTRSHNNGLPEKAKGRYSYTQVNNKTWQNFVKQHYEKGGTPASQSDINTLLQSADISGKGFGIFKGKGKIKGIIVINPTENQKSQPMFGGDESSTSQGDNTNQLIIKSSQKIDSGK